MTDLILLADDGIVTDEDGGVDFWAVPGWVHPIDAMRRWMSETGQDTLDFDGRAELLAMARQVRQGWMRPVTRDEDLTEWIEDGNSEVDHPWYVDSEYLWRVSKGPFHETEAQQATYWQRIGGDDE